MTTIKATLEQKGILSAIGEAIAAAHAERAPRPTDGPTVYSVKEAAALLGLSEASARAKLSDCADVGLLAHVELNRGPNGRALAHYTLPSELSRANAAGAGAADADALEGTDIDGLRNRAAVALGNLADATSLDRFDLLPPRHLAAVEAVAIYVLDYFSIELRRVLRG